MQNLIDYISKLKIVEVLRDNYILGHFMHNSHNILHDFVYGCDVLGNPTIYEDFLTESLTRSYDPNATIRIVSDFLKKGIEDFLVIDIHSAKDKENILRNCSCNIDINKEQMMLIKCKIFKNSNRENIDAVKKAFEFCGYYFAAQKAGGKPEYDWIYFYPKFQVKTNEIVRKENKCLYHITTRHIIEKISKEGFVPKSTNEKYDYPGRIHFLKENTPDSIKSGLIDGLKCQIKNSPKNGKDNRVKNPEMLDFVEIKIDLRKVSKDVNFYSDPDFSIYGLFTYDNINPEAIVDIMACKI